LPNFEISRAKHHWGLDFGVVITLNCFPIVYDVRGMFVLKSAFDDNERTRQVSPVSRHHAPSAFHPRFCHINQPNSLLEMIPGIGCFDVCARTFTICCCPYWETLLTDFE